MNSTGYCQPLDVGVFRSFKAGLRRLCTQEIAHQSIDGDFHIKEMNQRGFKGNAIGGWFASILAELAVQPKIRLNSWKHFICSTQTDFDETLASGLQQTLQLHRTIRA
eukprot:5679610-Amphidinium_carterae.1